MANNKKKVKKKKLILTSINYNVQVTKKRKVFMHKNNMAGGFFFPFFITWICFNISIPAGRRDFNSFRSVLNQFPAKEAH